MIAMVLVVALLVVLGGVVVGGTRRTRRPRREAARDDLTRAGDDAMPVTSREAARRAQGRTAWLRGGGGFQA